MNKNRMHYAETVRKAAPTVLDVPWTVAGATTALAPQASAPPFAPAAVPLVSVTRPVLLTWLYSPPATHLETQVAADLDLGVTQILTAHTLRRPVAWAEPVMQVGRFVRVMYTPIEQPDPDLIVTLIPGAEAFETAMRNFQKLRLKPRYGSWERWYQMMMNAARALVEPLLALRPTPAEAMFVLRWAALIAAGGYQNAVVDYF